MERLISLFREADYEKWSASGSRSAGDEPQVGLEEPLYFTQLLQYLREEREESKASAGSTAETADVIGARA